MNKSKKYMMKPDNDFAKHFLAVFKDPNNDKLKERHLKPYLESWHNYDNFEINGIGTIGKYKHPRQIEKDEKMWLASLFMTHENGDFDFRRCFADVLIKTFGDPIPGVFERGFGWGDYIGNGGHIVDESVDKEQNWCTSESCSHFGFRPFFLETSVPAPKAYKEYLSLRLKDKRKHLIPYVNDAITHSSKHLEGPTIVDCVFLGHNGLSIFIEAKVLSDISYQVTYDETRNQIARNIDAMLETPNSIIDEPNNPMNYRNKDRTFFLLLTPRLFKELPQSRLYGYKFNEYKTDPEAIGRDLPHRKLTKELCHEISKRIGWATWEDFNQINKNFCPWLNS